MATNPRVPPHRDVPTLAEQKRKKPASPLIALGILAAAVILVAIFFYLPRTPKRPSTPANAVVPQQPTGNQVQLSNIHLSSGPLGGQMYIYADLTNVGNTAINGVLADVTFPARNGQTAGTVTSRVESYENQNAVPLVDDPIQARAHRAIRIPIEHVPENWNHNMPGITIQDVTAIGH